MAKNSISDWDTTAGNNTDVGGVGIAGTTTIRSGDNAFREIMSQVADYFITNGTLASAATLNLDSVDNLTLEITGTTSVTAVTLAEGHKRIARAAAAFTLTAGASLIVNGSTTADYTTVAGDLLFFQGYGSSVVRVWTVGGLPNGGTTSVASATTTDLSAIAEETITVTGTTTITGLGTAAAGVRKTLVFGGSLTFTHNGSSLILPGSVNITTSAGDIAHMVSLGSGNWRCTNYTRGYVPPLLDRIVRAVADNAGNVVDARGVGSVTDDGTGLITFSLSENFGSANYALTATADDGTTTGQIRAVMITGKTTSAFALKCVNSSNALTDPSEYNAIAIGA